MKAVIALMMRNPMTLTVSMAVASMASGRLVIDFFISS